MGKKVPSPTGRPSKISKGNQQALDKWQAGKPTGGARPTAQATRKPVKSLDRAAQMDRGMPLSPTTFTRKRKR